MCLAALCIWCMLHLNSRISAHNCYNKMLFLISLIFTVTTFTRFGQCQDDFYSWKDIPTIVNETHLIFAMGPSGGEIRGYAAIRRVPEPAGEQVFYINGLLSPDIQVKRGVTYYIFPLTGLDNHVYITNDERGGYANLNNFWRQRQQVYAGLDSAGSPEVIGLRCDYSTDLRPRQIDLVESYERFMPSLKVIKLNVQYFFSKFFKI